MRRERKDIQEKSFTQRMTSNCMVSNTFCSYYVLRKYGEQDAQSLIGEKELGSYYILRITPVTYSFCLEPHSRQPVVMLERHLSFRAIQILNILHFSVYINVNKWQICLKYEGHFLLGMSHHITWVMFLGRKQAGSIRWKSGCDCSRKNKHVSLM